LKGVSGRGQAVVETIFMALLLSFLLVAIIQVFMVHNYAFQMANNAYYSLFKDVAYHRNYPDRDFDGYSTDAPNFRGKPLRSVDPWPQSPGRIHVLAGSYTNWTQDDRASVPMMPFYRTPIIDTMRAAGINTDPVRLKVGTRRPGAPYLDMKFMYVGSGTKGDYLLVVVDIAIGLVRALGELVGGGSYTDYTGGLTFENPEDADSQRGQINEGNDSLQDGDGNNQSKNYTFHRHCVSNPNDSRCRQGAEGQAYHLYCRDHASLPVCDVDQGGGSTGDEGGTWRDAF
jgi:hypothetical protein